MSSVHPSEASSAASTPRSEHHLPPPPHRWHHHPHPAQDGDEEDPPGPRVRLMCSFGGRILPRPHDHQLRYVGGETRIVAVPRAASLPSLLAKVAKLPSTGGGAAPPGLQIKYQLPLEDLDALISVTSDEDVEIMMEEHERLAAHGGGAARAPRLRLFLFCAPGSGTGPLGSLHDGGDDDTGLSLRRERWFLDALNSGAGRGSALERGRSEVSSVVSELPDYLSGLDASSDLGDSAPRAPTDRSEPVQRGNGYPESPVRRAPDHPREEAPVKLTGPPAPAPAAAAPSIEQETTADDPGMYPGGRTWQYVSEPVPVYYVSASLPQQTGPVPVPLHVSYGSSQPGNPAAVQAAYRRQYPMQAFGGGGGGGGNPIHASSVYVGGLPVAHTGPYGLPVSVPRSYLPAGVPYGHGAVNPVAGIPTPIQGQLLPDPGNKLEQGLL